MKVRIVNDGKHGFSTRITSVETGQELQYVTKATITLEASAELPTAELTIVLPVIDMVTEARITYRCPFCDHEHAYEQAQPEERDTNV